MHVNRPNNLPRREEGDPSRHHKLSPLPLLSFAALLVFCAGVLGLPFQYAEPDYIAAIDRASASGADLLRPRGSHEGTLSPHGGAPAAGRTIGTGEPGHSRIFGRIGQLRSLVDAKGADPVRPKSVPPKPTSKPVAKPQHKPKSDGVGDCIFSDYEDWKNEWVAYGSRISDCDKGFLTKLRGESGWNFNHPSKVVIKAVYRMISKDKAGKEVITEFVKTGSNLRSKLANGAKMVKVLAREPSKGFCQIHRDYHPEMWKDKRLWTDWKYQVETCYRMYKGGTRMYAPGNGKQHIVRKK